jgi:hypothetical protein
MLMGNPNNRASFEEIKTKLDQFKSLEATPLLLSDVKTNSAWAHHFNQLGYFILSMNERLQPIG